MSVFANKRKIVHKGNGLVETCPAPDVCKTPSPGGPVPIPYVNIANDSDLADGTKDVKIEGNMVALKGANLAMSSGDEGGTAGGGIVSSKIKGKMTWMLYSMDVVFENQGVVRFMEPIMHNGNASNVPNPQHLGGFDGSYPGLDSKAVCPKCGKTMEEHDPGFDIPQTPETKKAASDFREKLLANKDAASALSGGGRMVGVMVVKCGNTPPKMIACISGAGAPGWKAAALSLGMVPVDIPSPRDFAAQYPNQTNAPGSPTPPGACAAPRMLSKAQNSGCTPLAMSEVWAGASSHTQTDGHRAESCATCKANLPKMLCPNDEKKGKKPRQPLSEGAQASMERQETAARVKKQMEEAKAAKIARRAARSGS
jgi:hypothetical protein